MTLVVSDIKVTDLEKSMPFSVTDDFKASKRLRDAAVGHERLYAADKGLRHLALPWVGANVPCDIQEAFGKTQRQSREI